MYKMTTHERITRMFEHREADRIPISDMPWNTTIERWHREGMPENMPFEDYFDIDRVIYIGVDSSPQFEKKILEETDEYMIYTTEWGATLKSWKHITSTPEFLDFKIKTPDQWKEAKAKMQPGRDRIQWDFFKANYRKWRENGSWIMADIWFGFDVTHSWVVGTENLLVALIEEPEWCMDMFNHFLDTALGLLDILWDEGYRFDCLRWPDDMGYKHSQFFSVKTYRQLLKPVHKRAIDWAHNKGIKAYLHSCGDVNPFLPEFLDMGLDALNPLEVKAGMDPVKIKKQYGDKLLLHGGVNAVLWDNIEEIEAEMKSVVPRLKQSGGYIFGSDHSVPSTVSLENFRYITDLAKKLGKY